MFPLRDDRPTWTAPVVTTLLIVACAFVFFHELALDDYSRDYFIKTYGVVPARLHLVSLGSSMFLHGGWAHILGNMLFLWAFGKSLEDAMGHGKFLTFYLLCGVVASLTHIFFNIDSRLPAVGASGAIAGVMGGYLMKFPKAYIRTLVFFGLFWITDVPAAFILVYWFLTQLLSGTGAIAHTHVSDSGVAWFAHIGGFLAGMILVNVMGTRSRYFARRQNSW